MNPLRWMLAAVSLLCVLSAGAQPGASDFSDAPDQAEEPLADDLDVGLSEVVLDEVTVARRVKLRRPERFWKCACLGEIEILSQAPEAEARDALACMLDLGRAVEVVFPQLARRSRRPLAIILCDDRDMFERFTFVGGRSVESGVASVFAADGDMAVIVVDLDFERQNLTRRLQRVYAHYLISHMHPRLNAVVAEGLARVLSFTKVDGDRAHFGVLHVVDSGRSRIDVNWRGLTIPTVVDVDEMGDQFRQIAWVPLPDLFRFDTDAPELRNPINSAVAIEAQAFVHMCLFGSVPQRREAFWAFAERSCESPVTADMLRACFGEPADELDRAMAAYMRRPNVWVENRILEQLAPDERERFVEDILHRGGLDEERRVREKYTPISISLTPLDPPVIVPALAGAEPAAVARIKAEAFRLVGRADDAREELLSVVLRGQADADVYAAFGNVERSAGVESAALHYDRKAILGGTRVPGPYVHMAAARLRRTQVERASGRLLSTTEAAAILRLAMAARVRASVPRVDVYQLFADVMQAIDARLPRSQLAVLDEGVRWFPRDGRLARTTASALAHHGFAEDAHAVLVRALDTVRDEAAREQVRAMITQTTRPQTAPTP